MDFNDKKLRDLGYFKDEVRTDARSLVYKTDWKVYTPTPKSEGQILVKNYIFFSNHGVEKTEKVKRVDNNKRTIWKYDESPTLITDEEIFAIADILKSVKGDSYV